MTEPKTKPTSQGATEFMKTIESAQKREDGLALLEMFEKATGQKAVMWGTAIVGFGGGEWPKVAFSPRKQNLTLYIMGGIKDNPELEKLGKYKTRGGCLYINKLSDVDQAVLAKLIERAFHYER